MDKDQIARVAYFDRQFLRAADFVDEQAYQIAMRRRHHIAHHRWGIVEGLTIVNEEGALSVQAGMAIDGYGRELVLPNSRAISSKAFTEKNSSALDVWLLYDHSTTSAESSRVDVCDGKRLAVNDRRQEAPRLRIEKPDPDFPDPRKPKSVPEGDLAFNPARTPPDDPRTDWPVYLGRITQLSEKEYAIEAGNRPYIGLIGESIEAPSKRARITLGIEERARRFAIYTNDKKTPDLAIDKDGRIKLRGDAAVHGNLTIAGGALEFPVGRAQSEGAAPWQISHTKFKNEAGKTVEQLRVEIAQSDPPVGDNQFAIGHWSAEEEKFHACLTVDDQCNIIIHGNLLVEKQIKNKLDKVKTMVAPADETKRFLAASSLVGFSGVPTLLQLLDPSRRGTVNVPEFETAVRSAVQTSDETQLRAFLKVLLAEDASRKMIEDLSKK